MKIVFASNFFNHHQRPLSEMFLKMDGVEFHFIAFSPMPEERKKMGYVMDVPPYVCLAYESEASWQSGIELLAQADVVIAGAAPKTVIRNCLRNDKLVLRYSERPLKEGFQPLKYLPRLIRWHLRNPLNKRIYMLCASAYTAGDYRKFGLFMNRAYKWGYFPETKRYDNFGALLCEKNKRQLLWCGRFLDWKHPDDAIFVAKRLHDEGYLFTLNMIGSGEMESQLHQLVTDFQLEDCVQFRGAMSPEQVRESMEEAGIYLFTSDRREGWGAVLNESMNSGCAVVACDSIGSVPYLVCNGRNGLTYTAGDTDKLYENVRFLLEHPEEQERLGTQAYQTIVSEWNAEVAAQRLVALLECILGGEKSPNLFTDGPCSPE